MKKTLRFQVVVLAFFALFFGGNFQSNASHYQASDLTYLTVAPGIYQVSLRLYRDCSGSTLNSSENLNIRSVGCNAGRSIPLPQVSNPPGILPFGNPYCGTQTQSPCTTSSPANYEVRTYRATVTFTAAEQNCQEWILSVRLGNRPSIENLLNAQSSWLFTEAYLKLNNTINNSSPEIALTSVPVPFVCVGQPTNISLNATDPDTDSLSYELVRPLDDYNMPIAYSAITQNQITNPNPQPPFNTTTNPQTAILPAAYSATYPMPSYTVNWVQGQQVVTAQPYFKIEPVSGIVQLQPAVYHPNTPSADGRNKYAVVVQINEWRKLNGVMTKVGHIRRDMLVIVNQCANTLSITDVPVPAPVFGASVHGDSVIDVLACSTTRFMLKFQDPDIMDKLDVRVTGTVFNNGNYTFPGGANLQGIPGLVMKPYTNKQNKVNLAFYMTPAPSAVTKEYFLQVNVEDDHCPLKGRVEYVYRIRVKSSNNRLYPVNNNRDRTIALGDSAEIDMVFMRPDSINQNIAQYTFAWTDGNGGLPNGLRPNNQNRKDITVKPTQTTRYHLGVTSTLAGCRDTASVLVRVGAPNGISKAIKADGLTVFPNPFSSEINFRFSKPAGKNSRLLIYSVSGRLVDSISLTELANTGNLSWKGAKQQPAGQYIARLVSENGPVQTVKFIKLQ